MSMSPRLHDPMKPIDFDATVLEALDDGSSVDTPSDPGMEGVFEAEDTTPQPGERQRRCARAGLPPADNVVYVGGLPPYATQREVGELFRTTFGAVRRTRFLYDHRTRRSRGYGFVKFATQESADAAVKSGQVVWKGVRLTIGRSVFGSEQRPTRPRDSASEPSTAEKSPPDNNLPTALAVAVPGFTGAPTGRGGIGQGGATNIMGQQGLGQGLNVGGMMGMTTMAMLPAGAAMMQPIAMQGGQPSIITLPMGLQHSQAVQLNIGGIPGIPTASHQHG
eukprot:Hpha_TRINITY_DN15082_c0_g1::TRINITY_DN15082_c0_g1_i3::g.123584::m.123584